MPGLWRQPLVALAGGLLVLPFVVGWFGTTVSVASEIALFALVGFGYNLLLGYTGLTSFGHGAYFGLAAYAMALTQIHLVKGLVTPLAVGVLTAAGLGAVLGFFALRRRGVYFSLLTLAFTQMLFYIVFRWTAVTGGESGLGGIARPSLLGLDLTDQRTFYWLTAAATYAGAVLVWRVVHAPFGTVLQAIRENERRAGFIGYDVGRYTWLAFVLATTIAGLAGGLHALLKQFVYADLVHVTMSGEILAMTLVGGMRQFLGPAVGAAFFVLFREVLTSYTENWLLYFGLLFMAFVLFSPDGILGILRRLTAPLRREAEALAAMAGRVAPQPQADGVNGGPATVPGEVLLEAHGLVKRFGGLAAVDRVDLEVRAGELRALIGPNGAGKTTLFNLLSGLLPPDAGTVHFRGQPITGLAPHRIVARGISRSFQILTIFRELTVFENVRLAVQARSRHRLHGWRPAASFDDLTQEARKTIRQVGLEGLEAAVASSLSYGGQRLLEIGIALATRPTVLLLDEPLAGLSHAERERVAAFIKGLARRVTIVLIEHDIDRVLALSDRITVLHSGRIIADGPPAAIQADPEVRAAYLGGRKAQPAAAAAAAPAPPGEPLLTLEEVDTFYGKSHILHGVSLDVRRGEVVALLGRNGAGKTATLNTIVGLRPPRHGRVTFRGRDIAGEPPERIGRLGIGLAPQGRRVFPNLTVADNLRLARLARRDGAGAGSDGEARLLDRFPRLRARWRARAETLSGGELQMLAIARALIGDVHLLILDEPFEGLAPAVVEEVYATVAALRGTTAILLVEHNLDLALALADRVYVLDRGHVTYTGPARDLLTDLALRARVLWF
ncbi:MAG TPA: branched-chain amino acid ABC transporter ATP-binding protein/permease [Methylomirabilota bacterium]|nr:branched-chain amino acid ABC transporter ATP-binding protein/permease [Methylomirabilota bacterium]